MSVTEVNFDGLVGPTHNYGGLSVGNVASMSSQETPSNPREAALQGLAKMRRMLKMGFTQGFLPPHDRPHVETLRGFGFTGPDKEVVEAAGKKAPLLLRNVSSASSMWTANAATVTPSRDASDGKLHLTPANLKAMFHRSIEHEQTQRMLETAFPGDRFVVHGAVQGGGEMGDEGAANHGRLCASHDAQGLHLYTYGRHAFEKREGKYPARQALEASEGIARSHQVADQHIVYMKQADEAIDAGAFHNDVVAVADGPVLLYHQKAYEDTPALLDAIKRKAEPLGFEPQFIEVAARDVSLRDAIVSYLFNSQLLTRADGSMMLLLPVEAEENEATRRWCEEAVAGNGPIAETLFMDLRQSMRNGGGPACLRLRVALTAEELAATNQGFLLDEARSDQLEAWVKDHYRDRLTPDDLGDPAFLEENRRALDALTQIMGCSGLYAFQRG
ncbi:N-succinylarginine dihydrolase [Parvularcula sp. ZS-1/3]|uniref:N-succinylarginine dihydrolase n=1 Tax=Parvularcula mediterranea TaxID=2732508 RepID=A0A7Y3W640_9PROT|nr:N-succinylarginine dihydrolase [Parvularcula mediterranea]NNU16972.1 N-succinylarginine dihydrolase [Parvularcula mediterranea]